MKLLELDFAKPHSHAIKHLPFFLLTFNVNLQ